MKMKSAPMSMSPPTKADPLDCMTMRMLFEKRARLQSELDKCQMEVNAAGQAVANKYALGKHDSLAFDTGEITRGAAPAAPVAE